MSREPTGYVALQTRRAQVRRPHHGSLGPARDPAARGEGPAPDMGLSLRRHLSGQRQAGVMPVADTEAMLAHLAEISRAIAPGPMRY